ncbi:exonuclease domain-containing protein [Ruegeria sp. HKCCD6428]|uniref:exonuclease domain-containing protein n=1 Tax=Ruegeria sp. HKCCD6428 TaxID=2683002 RepID=UPI0014924A2A|nr:exonuclease domain-containing protein [Ruegeria sp. HKCCD6428]NOC84537.1 exodeoxyribonuclease I [Ruegeria sp. HKCCD6428]
MSFVFYDTETTGTDTTFDQILQFAAILTDSNLIELDRFETRCRLLPHVIPAPGALLATRVTPAMLTDPSLPTHYEMMLQIAEKLRAWSPAIFAGYNTLSFDEPLLRQAFYQTLQPVYLTNTNGNQRADVLRLAQATVALAPNAMAVPISAKGKPTLRLDTLAPANGFAHENAHDALADVEATIYMARLIRDRAPAVWASLLPLVDKSEATARLNSGKPKCIVEYHMGVPSVRAVVGCGQHPKNPTMQAVFDLRRDPAEVLNLSEAELVEETKGPNRALRTIYSNKMPALVETALAPDLPAAIGLPMAEIARRAAVVSADGQFAARVGKAMEQRYPPFESAQVVEGRMYEGFPSRADENRMQAFHKSDWPERAEIAETFEDGRYRELARRLVFANAPEALSTARHKQLQAWLNNRRHGRDGVEAGRTLADAISDLEKVETEHPAGSEPLTAIKHWLETF